MLRRVLLLLLLVMAGCGPDAREERMRNLELRMLIIEYCIQEIKARKKIEIPPPSSLKPKGATEAELDERINKAAQELQGLIERLNT